MSKIKQQKYWQKKNKKQFRNNKIQWKCAMNGIDYKSM